MRRELASRLLPTSLHSVTAAMLLLGACGSEPAATNNPAASATPATAAAPRAGAAGGPAVVTPGVAPVVGSTPAVGTAPNVTTPAGGAATPAIATPGVVPPAAAGAAGNLPCNVATVMKTACQNCHGAMPVGGAPMALVTYADLMKPANTQPTKKVYELVKERIHDTKRPMPPIGSLTPADIAAIDTWVGGGALSAPATESAACAPAPTVTMPVDARADGGMGRLTELPGEKCYEFKVHGGQTAGDTTKFGIIDGEFYEQFYYKVPWAADSVATAYATIKDNAPVLHHWLLFSTNEAQAEGSHINAPLPTLIGTDPILLAGWAVGGPNLVAPADVGFELPNPGARTINVQWHFYNSTGKMQQDSSSVQICVVPKAMRKNIGGVTWLGTEDLNGNKWFGGAGMPAKKESTFTTTCVPGRRGMAASAPIHILGFEPHMHRIGKNMKTAIKRSGGMLETVFDKPFNFGSETHYFADVDVMPGEQLVTSCSFNNDNDFGVPFGESSDTEMCYQFTFAYPAHALSNGAPSLLGVPDTCW